MTRQIIFAIILLSILSMTACGKVQSTMAEQEDENSYSIDFNAFCTAKSHELLLEKNDNLQVEITHNSGNIKLTIQGENGYEVYTGNQLISCDFTVRIPESGKYTIAIAGKNAYGIVRIFKVPK